MGPEIIALLIPLAAVIGIFMIPIVAILSAHQRKMAEVMHQRHTGGNHDALAQELMAMRSEISALRDQVNQLTIVSDRTSALTGSSGVTNSPPPLSDRLGNG